MIYFELKQITENTEEKSNSKKYGMDIKVSFSCDNLSFPYEFTRKKMKKKEKINRIYSNTCICMIAKFYWSDRTVKHEQTWYKILIDELRVTKICRNENER